MKQNERSAKNETGDKQPAPSMSAELASPLEIFFVNQLQDMYYSERRLAEALEEMAGSCTSEELEDAVNEHRLQTQRHQKRLKKIFSMIGREAKEKKCEAIEGLIREANEIRDLTTENTATRDAALIIALQKMEHYEIASYGGLLELALTMDLYQAASLLDKTLKEEEEADRELTYIAETFINVCAEQESPYSWQKETVGQ